VRCGVGADFGSNEQRAAGAALDRLVGASAGAITKRRIG
jgi:hypothetical protein